VAQCGLRHTEFRGCLGKAALAGDREESPEIMQMSLRIHEYLHNFMRILPSSRHGLRVLDLQSHNRQDRKIRRRKRNCRSIEAARDLP
jgi:hypothetical protein